MSLRLNDESVPRSDKAPVGDLANTMPIKASRQASGAPRSSREPKPMSTRASRWERARAYTRGCILEAAAKAFEESGYGEACMSRIAELAGFTKATIYAHYRDKARLFAVVMDKHAACFPLKELPDGQLLSMKEGLAFVALELQKLAGLDACRCYCVTLQRSGSGLEFYHELWAAYLEPYKQFLIDSLVREGVDAAGHHADLYVQLMLQSNSLQTRPGQSPSISATLALFQKACS